MEKSAPASLAERASLTRYAWLSVAAALVTIVLKVVAYLLTGSVGLLSDAMESGVNLVGGVMALGMLTIAARPADEDHPYGHGKAEYFSSGVEGTLILVAAVGIAYAAFERLLHPQPLEQVGIGLAVSVGASLVNLAVALVLLRAGKRYDSITLKANAHHLLTDVWTSGGVLIGVAGVALSGWQRLDPIVAILVAANIVWAGVRIVRNSVSGLMDTAIPTEELVQVQAALERHVQAGVKYHALRTRQAGALRFISLHLLVPGEWNVQQGHALAEQIEGELRTLLPTAKVTTHLEALEDPASWDDEGLRPGAPE